MLKTAFGYVCEFKSLLAGPGREDRGLGTHQRWLSRPMKSDSLAQLDLAPKPAARQKELHYEKRVMFLNNLERKRM